MVHRKKESLSSKIKAYINIIFYLKTIIAFHCVYMDLFTNLCWLDVSLQ